MLGTSLSGGARIGHEIVNTIVNPTGCELGRNPNGSCRAATYWHWVVDVPQDPYYLVYWGTYELVRHVNDLANYCGPVSSLCSVVTYTGTAGLVLIEAVGLGADVLGNLAKGESVWQQGTPDQALLGNQFGGRALSEGLGCLLGSPVPTHMIFPGFRQNGHINFAW
jgi:hypothetical protein